LRFLARIDGLTGEKVAVRLAVFLLCLGYLVAPAHSDRFPVTVPVQLRSDPFPARVNGHSTEHPIMVPFEKDETTIYLDRADYETLAITLKLDDLELSGGVFPARKLPPLRLKPTHFWIPWRDWAKQSPALAGSLLLAAAVALGAALKSWKAGQSRQVRLRDLRDQADANDSVLLKTVGNYLLVQRLGAGGMASVYRGVPADSLDEKESVAVKLLSQETMDDAAAISRFRREVDAYRRLDHPNIVRIYDWKEPEDGSTPYLILEYIRGETLRDALRRGPVPINQAMDWLGQLFGAMAYAHSMGMVHRDLKPENLMLDGNRLKVMDFGLARSVDASYLTQTGTVLGTPAYMAPEQLSQGSSDASVDQYALGLISYEVLCGRRPIEETDIARLLMRVLTDVPVPPSQHRPHLKKEIDRAILKMLEKAPEQRFPDVASAWIGLRS